MSNSTTLDRLHALAKAQSAIQARPWTSAFGSIGLFLHEEEASSSFASTGGDGVSFSFLDTDGPSSPIVMIVPASAQRLTVVGETLEEFLALGSRFGFFCLEDIVHRPDAFFQAYRNEAASSVYDLVDADAIHLLNLLRARLQVRPWPAIEARLAELHRKFASDLILAAADNEDDTDTEPPSATHFWESMLAKELARPASERDHGREAHIRSRLAEARQNTH